MHMQQCEARVTLSSDPVLFPDPGKHVAEEALRMQSNRSSEEPAREHGTILIDLPVMRSKGEQAATASGGTETRRI
jgi:hypothetical protein